MLLSYVFSFRNEEENISELVRRVSAISNCIEDCTYEMIFVNDASSDGSLELLVNLQKSYPITVVNMSRRFGGTPCVLAGLSFAKGDAIVYMDSDLQDPPELVREMVEKFRNGVEVVHTTRTKRDGERLLKMWVTKCAYALINYFSDIDLPENTGDYKLLSSKVAKKILELKEYDPYMRGLSVWVGFKQDFVYYRRDARFGGRTKFPLFSKGPITEFARGLTAFSAAPLLISFTLGLMTTALAALLILWAIFTKLLDIAAPGASGLLVAIGLFSGAILMSNGILGIYISKIYYEVKGRPRYIVQSVIEPNGFQGDNYVS